MKVALYEQIDGPIYGNQKYITMLAEWFDDHQPANSSKRIDFTVYLPTRRQLYTALKDRNRVVRVAPKSGIIAYMRWMLSAFRKERPDVILSNNQKSFLVAMWAALRWRIPIVLFVKDSYALFPLDFLTFFFARRVLAIAPESVEVKHPLVVSSFRNKIHHLPIGVYLDQFTRVPALKARAKNSKVQVLMVASIVPRKGVHVALDAMSQLSKFDVSVSLTIVGSKREKYEDYYVKVRDKAGRLDNVELLGWSDDVVALLKMSDIVILPSSAEGTPRSLVEAMAAARPVIASRVGGIPSLIQDGVTGILVEQNDPVGLSEAIYSLAKDDVRRSHMGMAAREYAKANHDFRIHMELLEQHLHAVSE